MKVLFNGSRTRENLSIGWGLSFLINNQILFDTGEKGEFLANNIKEMNIDLSRIAAVVISHDHWDHTGGLEMILKACPKVKVYGCAGFSQELKDKITLSNGNFITPGDFLGIADNIYISKEMKSLYKNNDLSELALVVETAHGLIVITGCAHAGILPILDNVEAAFPDKSIYAVLGGFHLMNKPARSIDRIIEQFQKRGIQKVGPTHCSGSETENIFRNAYKENFITLKVGDTLKI